MSINQCVGWGLLWSHRVSGRACITPSVSYPLLPLVTPHLPTPSATKSGTSSCSLRPTSGYVYVCSSLGVAVGVVPSPPMWPAKRPIHRFW